MPSIEVGITIRERFEVRASLGRGGYGQVWLCDDAQMYREVAIKGVIGYGKTQRHREEMVGEAIKIASTRQHPNVVVVYDAFEHDGEVFIVMEYLPRGSLEAYLQKLSREGQWIEPNEAFRLVKGILNGLAEMHHSDLGVIIHKDLKPSNILFDHKGQPKIADFGIASFDVVDALPTGDRNVLEHEGTPGYKSPEQMLGLRLDHRSDLFNAGMIAYLLFGGAHPFVDPRLLFGIKQMILEPYRALPRLALDVLPPEVDEFVARLLAVDPGDRFQSADEALAELDDVESRYQRRLTDRVLTYHDALAAGTAPDEAMSSQELAEGIALFKRQGFYIQGAYLYERSGVDFSLLTQGTKTRLEADYGVCKRRAGQEVITPL